MDIAQSEKNETRPLEQLANQLKVVSRRSSTPRDIEEVSAALAVVREVLAEEANQLHASFDSHDGWSSHSRRLRAPLTPGPGQWLNFSR